MTTLNDGKNWFIVKARSHYDGPCIFLRGCRCHHELVQYPFMAAMATEKMGIMEWRDSVHTAMETATEKIEFFKDRSHCDYQCCYQWVQYPFMTAMAKEKMGIMESSESCSHCGMHSSGMRTARLLTAFQHALWQGGGGCTCPGGVYLPGGCTCQGGVPAQLYTCPGGLPVWGVYLPGAGGTCLFTFPPSCGQTETCKNIVFANFICGREKLGF